VLPALELLYAQFNKVINSLSPHTNILLYSVASIGTTCAVSFNRVLQNKAFGLVINLK